MAPLPDSLLSLSRSLLPEQYHPTINADIRSLSPVAVYDLHLAKRSPYQANPAQGAKPAKAYNNLGIQMLFALIGVGMVLTSLWFFFWAKNGGFKWKENDWEDYKSTVLRRKGPDGKTLSNATKSTNLGGGSVVHGGSYGVESSVGYTDETGTSVGFGEMREVEEEKGRRHFGLRGGEAKKHRRESTSNRKDPELREYRHEKPARVGGLNRQADGIYTDYSNTEPSDLGSNVSGKPLVTPKDKKKEAKAKERRAKERMRLAKEAEKVALKNAAAEAKAKKENEKAEAKKTKAQQKEQRKQKKSTLTEATPTEATPTEAAPTEAALSEADITEAGPATAGPAGRRAPPSAAYSFTTGDDTNTIYTGAYTDNRTAPSEINESSYYSDYRPNADPAAFANATANRSRRSRPGESRSRHSSPRKQHQSRSRPSRTPSDIFTQTNGNVQGTISYPCHIPGLSSAGSVGVSESVSQVAGPSQGGNRRGGRDVMDGYRRGGVRAVGRRDSLSDSDA
ncbi:uncharacterized protein BDR25DRAFT_304514 [Lindgomyces ingoldianus]|uniref:Uncharacterized protein n=1 Tax=Lindgomyces ingoldianus TaxID=673940 RepID=A0ACB6QTK8_9PLEO|nr:uncharacterized protein BDR25DRAFT_304514 [Lindgomyces ingoldianus]KAF2469430.1 hypothetical protein BDR25DRAFT_304514 [Lindgomyces ingoldianus]